MKYWIGAVLCLLLVGCASKGPGESLEGYLSAMIKGDYLAFAEGLAYPGFDQVDADSLTVHIMEANKQFLDERYDGLKAVEIVQVLMSEDGKTATVRVELNFGNGMSEETEYEMILVDEKWKINLDI